LDALGDYFIDDPARPVTGIVSVKELFAEFDIPLLAEKRFAHSLTINGAARWSDYDLEGVGRVSTEGFGVQYSPISDNVRIRAQYQRAVRAPSVQELFAPQTTGPFNGTDPCSDRTSAAAQTPELRAVCEQTGVPVGAVFTPQIQTGFTLSGRIGGNPNLGPETSDTYTFGVVYSPSSIESLNLAVDYYKFDIEGAIVQLAGGVASTLNLCYNVLQNASTLFCRAVHRDLVTGELDFVDALWTNSGGQNREGVDIQADYAVGAFTLGFSGAYLLGAQTVPVAVLPANVNNCEGTFGLVCLEPDPKFKFTTRVTWTRGPLSVSARWRWLQAVEDDRIDATPTKRPPSDFVVPEIKEMNYLDLNVNYDLNESILIFAGIQNATDAYPNRIGSNSIFLSGTWPSTYDVIGRRFFAGMTARF
jgi:outer membrane receptor protein involved in Fe transport